MQYFTKICCQARSVKSLCIDWSTRVINIFRKRTEHKENKDEYFPDLNEPISEQPPRHETTPDTHIRACWQAELRRRLHQVLQGLL